DLVLATLVMNGEGMIARRELLHRLGDLVERTADLAREPPVHTKCGENRDDAAENLSIACKSDLGRSALLRFRQVGVDFGHHLSERFNAALMCCEGRG